MLGRTAMIPRHTTTAIKATAFALAVVVFFGVAQVALAQTTASDKFGVGAVAATGLTAQDPRIIIGRIIQGALGLLGIIAICLILYAGFLWMTAAGEAEKVEKAKRILAQAAIGLFIISSSFAITSFIVSNLLDATGQNGGISGGANGLNSSACIGLSASCPSGALGNSTIDSHFPGRGATGVARNTRIVVTFKEAIDPKSVILFPAAATPPAPTIAIIKSSAIAATSPAFETKYAAAATANDFTATLSTDGKILTFSQNPKTCGATSSAGCIGSPSENVFYTVVLRGGTTGIKKANGKDPILSGVNANGYLWEFQVSTILDLTPPTVKYAFPIADSTNPRNSMIHIDFSEPIDPISMQGVKNVTVLNKIGNSIVTGTVLVGAGYTSTEFRTDDSCGVNSCGEKIYCLPALATIDVTAHADDLLSAPTGMIPANGLTDMAGNSLDGNNNGKAEGFGKDDYLFEFKTDSSIDLTPPKVVDLQPKLTPNTGTGSIARDANVTVTFSKLMSSSSFTTDAVRLVPGLDSTGKPGAPINFSLSVTNLASKKGGPLDQSVMNMSHGLFDINQGYGTAMGSQLRDLQQNCFFPALGSSALTPSCNGSQPYCCNGSPSAKPCSIAP